MRLEMLKHAAPNGALNIVLNEPTHIALTELHQRSVALSAIGAACI